MLVYVLKVYFQHAVTLAWFEPQMKFVDELYERWWTKVGVRQTFGRAAAEKLTQTQIRPKSGSCFVIKSFNILKCLKLKKNVKIAVEKQKLMQSVALTGLSEFVTRLTQPWITASLQWDPKEKKCHNFNCVNKNVQCKTTFNLKLSAACTSGTSVFTRRQDELVYFHSGLDFTDSSRKSS